MRQRALVRGGVAALALVGSLATCRAERERLDVPRLKLTVDQQAVQRGGEITGTVTATDVSGLTYLRVWAWTGDSLMSRYPRGDGAGTLYGDDSVTYRFGLLVTCLAPDASPVKIEARTVDNQGFDVARFDTVIARGAECPQTAAARTR